MTLNDLEWPFCVKICFGLGNLWVGVSGFRTKLFVNLQSYTHTILPYMYVCRGVYPPNNQSAIPFLVSAPPFSSSSPLLLLSTSPSFPPLVLPSIPVLLGGLEKRCKFPQWGLGQNPSRHQFWCILTAQRLIWQHLLYGFLYRKLNSTLIHPSQNSQ